MADLNFHHLRLFQAVAHEGHLTRAAQRLHVTPSAVSTQLRQLEDRLGHPLFERRGRELQLTEAGRIALDHADEIFRTGAELLATLKGRPGDDVPWLRVGSVATLSRNFQLQWLKPLIESPEVRITLHSGQPRELLAQLSAHTLDVVLSNEAVPRDMATGLISHRVAEQPLSLVSKKPRGRVRPLRFPDDLEGMDMVLPGQGSAMRLAFDQRLASAGVRVNVVAEVDDMAMLRLFARESGALTLVPPVVVHDELASGRLVERLALPYLVERFYAITAHRRFVHPALRAMLSAR